MIAKDRKMNFAALLSWRSLREVEVKYYLAKFAMIAKDKGMNFAAWRS